MNRISRILHGPVEYQEDVSKIKEALRWLEFYTDKQVELLFSLYSEETHCAAWLSLNCVDMSDFERWLETEV